MRNVQSGNADQYMGCAQALSVLSAASKLSNADASSLEVILRNAFNSADPSNPAAQAYSVLSTLSALSAAPAGAPLAAPAADRHTLDEAAPAAKAAAIPDFSAQVMRDRYVDRGKHFETLRSIVARREGRGKERHTDTRKL
jgi:hypothetical protein